MMKHEKVELFEKARSFIGQCYLELGKNPSSTELRISEVKESIFQTGSYTHTFEELEIGAKLAWRNNSRCIGRFFWNHLTCFDFRSLKTEEEIFHSIIKHIIFGTHQGQVRPAISIYHAESDDFNVRIWNHQLIRYAGYETERGVIGDPSSVIFTKQCIELGWHGEGTAFDVLPIVLQINNKKPKWFSLPSECILEVPIVHPTLKWFEDLQLKWYAVPFVSDMLLEIGGLHYTAAPFNGWYMGTEIASRNLADHGRYNQLPNIAERMGLNTSSHLSLWKDKAMVELNEAVLYSFRSNKVSIVDHHTASEQFMRFDQQEQKMGREVSGRWSWLIPPLSPSTSTIWHKEYKDQNLSPNYVYQQAPYPLQTVGNRSTCPFSGVEG